MSAPLYVRTQPGVGAVFMTVLHRVVTSPNGHPCNCTDLLFAWASAGSVSAKPDRHSYSRIPGAIFEPRLTDEFKAFLDRRFGGERKT